MTEVEEISKEHLSLAGEYAVASELCKRGIYAQLTLGTRKKTDLLMETDTGMLRIQVKAKQRGWWICKGIFGKDIVLVLVDFENKALDQRPDFYVLTVSDWENFVNSGWVADYVSEGKMVVDDKKCPIWISRGGKPSRVGAQVTPADIKQHKERWDKIQAVCMERSA